MAPGSRGPITRLSRGVLPAPVQRGWPSGEAAPTVKRPRRSCRRSPLYFLARLGNEYLGDLQAELEGTVLVLDCDGSEILVPAVEGMEVLGTWLDRNQDIV